MFSHVQLVVTPWNSPGIPEWVAIPYPGDLPDPGIKPRSPALQVDSLPAELPGKPKNTGVGSLSLLQGIFPTQGLNPGLPHCRWILYHLSYQGSPRILEWVAYPFSRGSSWPRNRTGVSCIADRFFTSWATREAQSYHHQNGYMGRSVAMFLKPSLFTSRFIKWIRSIL